MRVVCEAMQRAADKCLPKVTVAPAKPWISARTLELIAARNAARMAGQRHLETEKNRRTRKRARKDR